MTCYLHRHTFSFILLLFIIFDNLFLSFYHQAKESIGTYSIKKKNNIPFHSMKNQSLQTGFIQNLFHARIGTMCSFIFELFYYNFFLHNIVHASDSLPAVLNCIQCSYVFKYTVHLSFLIFSSIFDFCT